MRTLRWSAASLAAFLLAGCSTSRPPEKNNASVPPPAKILQFYASPPVVAKGEMVTLCYGVDNATAVRLEPPIEPLTIAYNRCIHFAPAVTRKYTLVAKGADGSESTNSIEIQVAAREPAARREETEGKGRGLIETFAASALQVSPGQPVTLCYAVRGVESVRIEPDAGTLPARDRNCAVVRPSSTVTYTLTATAGAKTEQQRVTIRVQ